MSVFLFSPLFPKKKRSAALNTYQSASEVFLRKPTRSFNLSTMNKTRYFSPGVINKRPLRVRGEVNLLPRVACVKDRVPSGARITSSLAVVVGGWGGAGGAPQEFKSHPAGVGPASDWLAASAWRDSLEPSSN